MNSDIFQAVTIGLIAILIFVAYWFRGKPAQSTLTDTAIQMINAAVIAKDIVAATEQLWLTGKLAEDDRYDYAFRRLQESFPALTQAQLRTIIEGAVFLLKQGLQKWEVGTLESVKVTEEKPDFSVLKALE